jgi:amino acid transporter
VTLWLDIVGFTSSETILLINTMLGLVLVYFIGKKFHELANDYEKSPWPFAILGVATYYAGTFLFGLLLGITLEIFSPGTLEGMHDFVLGLIAIPFGLFSCWGLYYLLRRIWEGQRVDAMESMEPKDNY